MAYIYIFHSGYKIIFFGGEIKKSPFRNHLSANSTKGASRFSNLSLAARRQQPPKPPSKNTQPTRYRPPQPPTTPPALPGSTLLGRMYSPERLVGRTFLRCVTAVSTIESRSNSSSGGGGGPPVNLLGVCFCVCVLAPPLHDASSSV